MDKPAPADVPIHDLLTRRWSPRAFADRPVEPEKLRRVLEAARWAPSSYNEQPWTFILAERTDQAEFARMLECLVEGNRVWAKNVGVLMLTVVSKYAAKVHVALARRSGGRLVRTFRGGDVLLLTHTGREVL